jgi:rhodanese-related sulfurtransferase
VSKLISLAELVTKIGRGTLVVVEALPPAHHARGHLPGALNLPLESLDAAAFAALPDKDAEIVVYCSGTTCANSHTAQRRLEALGYSDVRVFPGGKAEWTASGHDLEVA